MRRVTELRPPDHGPGECFLRQRCPELARYLYDGTWDGLTPRRPGALSMYADGGMVALTLKLPSEGQQITLRAMSFGEALDGLERCCVSGDGAWREMDRGTGHQKKRDLRKKALDELKARNDDIS